MVVYTRVPALEKWRKEDQNFNITLGYVMSSESSFDWRLLQQQKQKRCYNCGSGRLPGTRKGLDSLSSTNTKAFCKQMLSLLRIPSLVPGKKFSFLPVASKLGLS